MRHSRPPPAVSHQFVLAAMLLGVAAQALAASVDAFPTRPVRVVVPAAAGGTLDIIVRTLAPGMSEGLGQVVVVENRATSSTTAAEEYVARATADGHTLFMAGTSRATNPIVYIQLSYDSWGDLIWVSLVATSGSALVTGPATQAATVRADRSRESPPRPASVWHGGPRLQRPSGGRDVQPDGPCDADPGAIPGSRPRPHRSPRRADPRHFRQHPGGDPARPRGQAARPRRHVGDALIPDARRAHDRGGRPRRLRGDGSLRADHPRQDAQRLCHPPEHRGSAGAQAGTRQGALRQPGTGRGRQHPRGVSTPHHPRVAAPRQGDQGGGNQTSMRRGSLLVSRLSVFQG